MKFLKRGKIIHLAEADLSSFVSVLQVSQCLMWNHYLLHTCTTCSGCVNSPCLSGPYALRKTKSSLAPSGAASSRKPGWSKPSRASLNWKPLPSLRTPSPSFSNRMNKTSPSPRLVQRHSPAAGDLPSFQSSGVWGRKESSREWGWWPACSS